MTLPAPAYTAPDPIPSAACGQVVEHPRRCGATPVVARLTRAYSAEPPGVEVLLCAKHRDALPETVSVPGDEGEEEVPTTEPL